MSKQGAVRLDAIEDGRACVLSVRAQPGARRRGLAGTWNEHLKIAVTAPAQDGRANADLLAVLAELLGARASDLELVSGHTARSKRVRIARDVEKVRARIEELIAEGGS